jgi:hypothetical protein
MLPFSSLAKSSAGERLKVRVPFCSVCIYFLHLGAHVGATAEALAASTVKLEGRDVLATWKVLVSLGMAPVLYTLYLAIAVVLSFRHGLPLKYKIWVPIWTVFALPAVGYCALKFGEVGMDLYKYGWISHPLVPAVIDCVSFPGFI